MKCGKQTGPSMISTCVPGLFVRIQLFRMPGEVRKFRRRTIVAFLPTCNREREVAALHASVSDGISTIGVSVESTTGVSVGKGRGVNVGVGMFVPVGDGIKTAVAVSPPEADVPVCDGIDVIGRKVAVSPKGGR